MKSFALPLTLVVIAASFVVRPAAGATGQIIIGPVRVVIGGGGPGPQPRPYVPNARIVIPTPNGGYYPRPFPQPQPQPAPRPTPQPAPVTTIPTSLQGNWVERFPNGDVWFHNLSASGQHIVTTIPAGGQPSSVTSKASFSQGNLTISNGTFGASLGNGTLTLSRNGMPGRTWTRSATPAPAPGPQPGPQPGPAPSNMVYLIGTWYEHQTAADGSPELWRYDLNTDGSYDMFKYGMNSSGNWDLNSPKAHLGAKVSADARPWDFDGQSLTLAAGQPYAEGPMKYSSTTGGVRWTSSRGVRTWTKSP